MAARENQGYLIAVIILVLMTLVLALAAFLGISKASEQADNREAAEKRLVLADKLVQANEIEAQIYKAFIGEVGGPSVAEVQTQIDSIQRLRNDANLDESQKAQIDSVVERIKIVQAIFDGDMKQNIASEGDDAPQEFTWKGLVKNLSAVLAKKHNQVSVLRNDVVRVEREARAEIDAKQKTVEETQKSLARVSTELNEEKKRALAKEQQLQDSLDQITRKNSDDVKKFENERNQLNGEIAKHVVSIGKLEEINSNLKRRIDLLTKEDFDIPDGKIVRVSPKLNKVYLNLGWTDGLRPNRTFAIYDKSVTNFQKGDEKALIEVIDITGPHSSEARVTREDPLNPILHNDHVLTATWDPGYRVPIALVGIIDLDNDGKSDRLRLVQMIEKNGGTVVAQHDESGKVIGKIDTETRYVVLGNSPSSDIDFNPNVQLAVQTLTAQAKENSVQQISVRKLLNWMGVHGRAKVEFLDSRAGDQFLRRDVIDTLKPSEDR